MSSTRCARCWATRRSSACAAVRNARYAERLALGITALDGIETVLASLHGRVQMGVVTSSNAEHFEIIHRTTGLLRY